VVELRIFEGEGAQKTDITFAYHANFFLFATLENARPMLHARGQQAASQQPPVLTGMPVSGMAYLDRPSEAGYFIFPDLSVRHEGRYRLSFNLYEETKDEVDQDIETPEEAKETASLAPNGSFDWRLEVKSSVFQVFSAKKFPGLAESTALSRTVAEQGCRVRIRRDVRMRRRDGKANADYDDYEDEFRRQRSISPVEAPVTARPPSPGLSNPDRLRYGVERRESAPSYQMKQYPSSYHSAPSAQSPSGAYPYGNGAPPQQPQYHQPQDTQPSQSGTHSQQGYAAPPQYAPNGQYRVPQTASNYFDRQPYQSYSTSTRESVDLDYRRASAAGYAAASHVSQPVNGSYASNDQHHSRPPGQYAPYQRTDAVLAPLELNSAATLDPKYDSLQSPLGRPPPQQAQPPYSAVPTSAYSDRGYSSFAAAESTTSLNEPPRAGTKRTYDSSFGGAYNEPLRNGTRPTTSHNNVSAGYADHEEIEMDHFKMQYRRADGSIAYSRELPALQ
jgi:hypothetical protein